MIVDESVTPQGDDLAQQNKSLHAQDEDPELARIREGMSLLPDINAGGNLVSQAGVAKKKKKKNKKKEK